MTTSVNTPSSGARLAVLTGALRPWSLADVLSATSSLGVDLVELAIGPEALGQSAHEVLALAGEFDTGICGVSAPLGWPVGDHRLSAVADFGADVGARFVRTFAPRYDQNESPFVQLDRFGEELRALHRSLPPAMEVLIEVAQGTIVPSPSIARTVLEGLDLQRVGVVYDPGNMVVEGHMQPDYAISLLGPFLRHVHAKNTVMVRDGDKWTPARSELQSGYVDWTEVATSLQRHGYRGVITIDHLSGPVTQEVLQRDVTALRKVLGVAFADRPIEARPGAQSQPQ